MWMEASGEAELSAEGGRQGVMEGYLVWVWKQHGGEGQVSKATTIWARMSRGKRTSHPRHALFPAWNFEMGFTPISAPL